MTNNNICTDKFIKSMWNIVLPGKPLPPQNQVVVGFWDSNGMRIACMCYYDYQTGQWFDADPNSDGEETCAPDYWIISPEDE